MISLKSLHINQKVKALQLRVGRAAITAFCRLHKSGFVECLVGWRNVESRVLLEEAVWLEHDADSLNGHDREILRTRVVGKGKGCKEVSTRSGISRES